MFVLEPCMEQACGFQLSLQLVERLEFSDVSDYVNAVGPARHDSRLKPGNDLLWAPAVVSVSIRPATVCCTRNLDLNIAAAPRLNSRQRSFERIEGRPVTNLGLSGTASPVRRPESGCFR